MPPNVPIRVPRWPARAALLSAALLAVVLPVAAAGSANAAPQPTGPRMTLPAPTGPHRIGTTTLHLVDTSRPDPWVATDPSRELMVQLFYPASTVAGYPRAPWMSPATARHFEADNGLPVLDWPLTNSHVDAPVQRHRGGWPVVIYSPGLPDDRETNTVEFEELASHGYVVATIDSVHDAAEVELPDGEVATSAIPLTQDNVAEISVKEVASKAADVGFVLDQLTALDRGGNPDQEHRALPAGLRGALDIDRIGMFGHSNGGSTTAHAMHVDPRIKVGADFDGNTWTPEAQAGSDRPMLLFGSQTPTPVETSTWAELRKNQRGPLLQLRLAGSTHLTFTDDAVLVPQVASVAGFTPERVVDLIGPDGPRAVTVLRTYLVAWFDRYLRQHDSHLLAGPSPKFPEVQFMP